MEDIIAKVIRIDLDIYVLNIEKKDEIITAKLRGNTKKKENVLVGDIVKVEKINSDYMIKEVLARKNQLIRPPVSNIDQMIIVLSVGEPIPDYILLDKQIVLCLSKSIIPIICVNKIDLVEGNENASKDLEYIKNVYSNLGIDIIFVSAKEHKGIDKLKKTLKGKTSAFSGNSGVGKTSITKEILNIDTSEIEIGDIGRKTKRGKHTTKSVKLYNLDEFSYILDTPGFSSYELYDMEHKKLKDYYPEFNKCRCDYDDCVHIIENEDVCDIKRKVRDGIIDSGRYDRYVYIYNKLKEKYDKRYK